MGLSAGRGGAGRGRGTKTENSRENSTTDNVKKGFWKKDLFPGGRGGFSLLFFFLLHSCPAFLSCAFGLGFLVGVGFLPG